MLAVVEFGGAVKLQVGFVDQGRCLHRRTGADSPSLATCHAADVLIENRHQLNSNATRPRRYVLVFRQYGRFAHQLQLEMEADRPELDRATVAIVGRIANVLKIRAQLNLQRALPENLRTVVEGPRELCPVVQLQDLLMTIVEPAITQQ